jgi:hypothetical protein
MIFWSAATPASKRVGRRLWSANLVSQFCRTMFSIGTAPLNSLRAIDRSGDFSVGGLREIFMPAIDVEGVGGIAFPILPEQAERLVAIAKAAPYDRGEDIADR